MRRARTRSRPEVAAQLPAAAAVTYRRPSSRTAEEAAEQEEDSEEVTRELEEVVGVSAGAEPTLGADGQPPNETDDANYFCEYAYMYHQMDMLEDAHRTGSYYTAIMSNPSCFQDKVVLDVGAGTCILSMFAAKAGARRVYAVEATDMADRARTIVASNGFGDVIRVLKGTVETVTLPEQVDVIVSEWMGYFLLRESMLDSVLIARDRHLKPSGSLFPSHATLFLAPVGSFKPMRDKMHAFQNDNAHYASFTKDMKACYGIDFSNTKEDYLREQRKYYLQTGLFANLTPKLLAGAGKPLLKLDLRSVSLSELTEPSRPLKCSMKTRVVWDWQRWSLGGVLWLFRHTVLGQPFLPGQPGRDAHNGSQHWHLDALGAAGFRFLPSFAGAEGGHVGLHDAHSPAGEEPPSAAARSEVRPQWCFQPEQAPCREGGAGGNLVCRLMRCQFKLHLSALASLCVLVVSELLV